MRKNEAEDALAAAGRALMDARSYNLKGRVASVELAAVTLAASLWEVSRDADVEFRGTRIIDRIAALPEDADFEPETLLHDHEIEYLPAARLVIGLTYSAARDDAMMLMSREMGRM
jgi:hypothetical protein